MKARALLGALLLLTASAVRCEDIAQVLERSQQMQLDLLSEVEPPSPAAAALQDDFQRLRPLTAAGANMQLRVVSAGAVAQTLHGRVVVMNVGLGALPQACRMFLLAHEIGHIALEHWAQRVELYRQFIPGEVVQVQTDAVAPQLGRAASLQAHAQEYEADAYAMRTLLDLGYSRDELLEMFYALGKHGATATHPSSGKRLAQLRLIVEERRLAEANAGR